MTGGKSRWLGFASVAGASAGLLLLISMMNSAFAYGDTTAITGDYAGVPVEVMGASGLPNPLTQPGSGSNSRSGRQVKRLKVGSARRFSATTRESLVADLRSILAAQHVTRAREIATRMSKPAESVTAAADLLEETASRRGFG